MPTTVQLSQLNAPIDAMYLIHKALHAEAERVEEAVNQLPLGGSFKPFQRAFYRWAMALGSHLEMEDRYITTWLPDALLAQEQEAGQRRLMEMLEDLQTYLQAELGRMIVIPRTQRQLRGRVIALWIVQDDLLEEEEEHVLPLIRQHMSAPQQLETIRHLLTDAEAAAPGGMPAWVTQGLTVAEQQVLAALDGRWAAPYDAVDQPQR